MCSLEDGTVNKRPRLRKDELVVRLGNGIVLLKGFIEENLQQEIVISVLEMGARGFYDCTNERFDVDPISCQSR